MKNLKKIFAGLLMATAAFGFFGCSTDDSEEDEGLTISFTESGTSTKTVTMKAESEKSGDADVYILYTLDGSEPKVDFAEGKSKADLVGKTGNEVLGVLEYGSASRIASGDSITISETTKITARAFYIVTTDSKPLKTGPLATQDVTVTSSSTAAASADNATGAQTFKLAQTGNTNTTHYFDTSDKPFPYTYDGTKYEKCYYQIQFSWKGAGKGNWYLYVREIGKAAPIGNKTEGTNFLAKGVYTGDCFNDSKGTVTDGTLTLNTLKGNSFGTATITGSSDSPSFEISIDSNTANTNGNVAQAINDAK